MSVQKLLGPFIAVTLAIPTPGRAQSTTPDTYLGTIQLGAATTDCFRSGSSFRAVATMPAIAHSNIDFEPVGFELVAKGTENSFTGVASVLNQRGSEIRRVFVSSDLTPHRPVTRNDSEEVRYSLAAHSFLHACIDNFTLGT